MLFSYLRSQHRLSPVLSPWSFPALPVFIYADRLSSRSSAGRNSIAYSIGSRCLFTRPVHFIGLSVGAAIFTIQIRPLLPIYDLIEDSRPLDASNDFTDLINIIRAHIFSLSSTSQRSPYRSPTSSIIRTSTINKHISSTWQFLRQHRTRRPLITSSCCQSRGLWSHTWHRRLRR